MAIIEVSDDGRGLSREQIIQVAVERGLLDPDQAQAMRAFAEEASALGAGELRIHTGSPADPPYVPWPAEGYKNQPEGAGS